jgi:hypothetical protein
MSLTKSDKRVIGSYMEIRAAAQDLGERLVGLLEETAIVDAATRATLFSGALKKLDVLRHGCDAQVTKSLGEIEAESVTSPEQRAWAGDHAVRVRNRWSLVTTIWPAAGLTADEIATSLRTAAMTLDEVVYWCESLTLTSRLADILENVRVGKSVTISSVLGNELPRDPDLRAKLIAETADQDGVLRCGYFDGDAGIVYRVASTRWGQRWSAIRIVLAVGAGLGLVVVACFVSPGEHWPFERSMWLEQLKRCAFLIGGAVAHIVIQGVTVSRRAKTSRSRPWNDWVTWINAHETQVIQGLASLFLGFFMLSFTMKGFTWPTAFFAGYTIDSWLDTLLDRFEQLATSKAKTFREAGSPTSMRI